jgi:hypothetical protein
MFLNELIKKMIHLHVRFQRAFSHCVFALHRLASPYRLRCNIQTHFLDVILRLKSAIMALEIIV